MNLDKRAGGPEYAKIVDALAEDDKARTDFLKACLLKLGLQVTQETTTVPSLSSLHLSSLDRATTAGIFSSLQEIITTDGKDKLIKDENDTFRIEKSGVWNMDKLNQSLPDDSKEQAGETPVDEGIVDYNSVVKHLVIHDEFPLPKLTPYFNHHSFYSNLQAYQSRSREGASQFGASLIHGEVITSTNTILEK